MFLPFSSHLTTKVEIENMAIVEAIHSGACTPNPLPSEAIVKNDIAQIRKVAMYIDFMSMVLSLKLFLFIIQNE